MKKLLLLLTAMVLASPNAYAQKFCAFPTTTLTTSDIFLITEAGCGSGATKQATMGAVKTFLTVNTNLADFNNTMESSKIINLANPTNLQDAATKGYVDGLVQGVSWKDAVTVAATGNIVLSGEQTIDGVLTSADRVLLSFQSTGTENGIYISNASTWTRSLDADTGAKIVSSTVKVEQGTVNQGRGFTNNNTGIVLGVTAITYADLGDAVNHNSTIGVQGGQANELFHLTTAQHTSVIAPSAAQYTRLAAMPDVAIAGREDTPTDEGIAVWDAATSKLVTSSSLVFDGTRLGIGTDAPNAKLEVNGTSLFSDNMTLLKDVNGTTSFTVDNGTVGGSASAALILKTDTTNADFQFIGLGSGVGDSGGIQPLTGLITANTAATGGISLVARAASADLRIYAGGIGTSNLVSTFLSNGNVLIGTTTDTGEKLQVNGDALISTGVSGATAVSTIDDLVVEGSGSTGLSLLSPDASFTQLAFGSPSDTLGASIGWNYINNEFIITSQRTGAELVFRSGLNNEAIRIKDNGNVLIGTAVDTGEKLQVNGTIKANAYEGLPNTTLFISTADATVANTAVETSIVPAGVGSTTIPSESLNQVGAKFKISVQGIISDSGNPLFTLRSKLGGVTIGDSGANALGSISNDHWIMEVEFVVRTIGVSGTIMATGSFITEQGDHFGLVNLGTIVIDTTQDQIFDCTVEWGTASASNSVTGQIAEIHELNI